MTPLTLGLVGVALLLCSYLLPILIALSMDSDLSEVTESARVLDEVVRVASVAGVASGCALLVASVLLWLRGAFSDGVASPGGIEVR